MGWLLVFVAANKIIYYDNRKLLTYKLFSMNTITEKSSSGRYGINNLNLGTLSILQLV